MVKYNALKCSRTKMRTAIPRISLQMTRLPSHHNQLFTTSSPSRGTIQQRLVRVSHSPASDDRKGKCVFLPLPARCPSFHPSVTSFPLSLRLSSLDPSLLLTISAASFSCVVYIHVRAWPNSVLGHDSALEHTASCVL